MILQKPAYPRGARSAEAGDFLASIGVRSGVNLPWFMVSAVQRSGSKKPLLDHRDLAGSRPEEQRQRLNFSPSSLPMMEPRSQLSPSTWRLAPGRDGARLACPGSREGSGASMRIWRGSKSIQGQ